MLENLQPAKVFTFFEEICHIPHGSYHTDKISAYLVDFAAERNLWYKQDEVGNVIIIKEATPGYEEKEPIIIQGHMDMVAVKEDGKLDLSIREKALTQILIDAEKVLQVIESFDGALPFNDKANPEVIKREMQMSKNEFKKAVGHLLKSGKIEITEKSIRLK